VEQEDAGIRECISKGASVQRGRGDRIFNSAETGYEKPHPRAFQHVIESLGAPRSIWMVGDNPVADIEGARAVGMNALLVRAAGESLLELPRVLTELDAAHWPG
jgi:putative hydrolase of the HAD superfamily